MMILFVLFGHVPSEAFQAPMAVTRLTPTRLASTILKEGGYSAMELEINDDDDNDVPTLTLRGGYTHTSSSKAKISAANKGKVPWNKGTPRSDEVRARIAEGVRKRNRERFLVMLAEENITEEEYLERKKADKKKKDTERRKRRTARGGYTPTEETRQKISQVLREKYATGEVKRAPRDPSTVRRGFSHSDATKEKIRETLKRKWAEDVNYRESMMNKTIANGAVSGSIRQRIAETLKKKWEDPDFRAEMLDKFKNRKAASQTRDQSHRQRISSAIKRKWMDEEYRKRALEGMAKGREGINDSIKIVKPMQPRTLTTEKGESTSKTATNANDDNLVGSIQQVKPLSLKKKVRETLTTPDAKTITSTAEIIANGVVHDLVSLPPAKLEVTSVVKGTRQTSTKNISKGAVAAKQRKSSYDNLNGDDDDVVWNEMQIESSLMSKTTNIVTVNESLTMDERYHEAELEQELMEHHPDGCISQLREERRDLYDLLYGDEDKEKRLDDFDPYGLPERPP